MNNVWGTARKLGVLLCIAAILFAAFTAPVTGALPAMFVPVWIYLFCVTIITILRGNQRSEQPRQPFLLILASRPPPFA